MKLSEIFDQLRLGEFSQLTIAGEQPGVVTEKSWPTLLGHINLGLTAIFTRFNLKEGRVLLALQSEQTVYNLTKEHALSNTRATGTKYLIDSVDAPFKDDILKITKVLTDDNTELGLNNQGDTYSVTTPSALTLRVPRVMVFDGLDVPDQLNTTHLQVVYRATHQKLVVPIGFYEPSRVEIELPVTHLQALLFFVASRVHAPVGLVNELNFSNMYYQKYEAECQRLENEGMEVDDNEQTYRLFRNGWV